MIATMHDTPLIASATLMICSTVFSDTINVPADHATIQQAIAAAENGDEILVAAGTYAEHVNFLGKTIELKSIDGPEATIIDGLSQAPTLVTVTGGEGTGTLLAGFTIINGRANDFDIGGGIHVGSDSSLAIENCVVRDCFSPHGGGINVQGSYLPGRTFSMRDCLFIDCSSVHSAGLAWINGSQFGETRVERCRFISGSSHNGAVCVGGPVQNGLVSTDVLFADCEFEQNSGSPYGALTICRITNLQVERCLFRDNNCGGGGDAISVNCFNDGGHVVVRNSVFMENGEPTCGHNYAGANSSARIENSVFCSNDGTNLSDGWETENIRELKGCPVETDCDGDGQVDWIQCAFNPEIDLDGNLVPDWCDSCIGDVNGDGTVDAADLGALLALWGTNGNSSPRADANQDGIVDAADLGLLLGYWGDCP